MAASEPPITVVLTDLDDQTSFYLEGRHQGYCALCRFLGRDQVTRAWQVHHVLSKQHCKKYGAPRYSPDDALRLCAGAPHACHERHTTHQELLPVGCLRDENIAFVVHWLGAAAEPHFGRYYTGSDPRLDAVLEQL